MASAYNITPAGFANARARLAELVAASERDIDELPNALSTMWCYITERRDEAETVLRERLLPVIHRPEEVLRERLAIGGAADIIDKLAEFARCRAATRLHLARRRRTSPARAVRRARHAGDHDLMENPRQLSGRQARRIAVRAQLLDANRPRGLIETVQRLGVLQNDPTNAVARNADLVLWSRLGPGYSHDELQAALDGRALIEINLMIRPAEDVALHRAEMAARRIRSVTAGRARLGVGQRRLPA